MKIKQILIDKSFQRAIVLTLIFLSTGVAFLLLGWADYGWLLFVVLPIVLGFAIGALPDSTWAMVGAVIATCFALAGLLMLGVSGFICAFMSIPIILPLIFLGSVVTHLVKRFKAIRTGNIQVLLLPLVLFIVGAPIERQLTSNKQQLIEVRTTGIFEYTPHQVYDAIKSVDTLFGEEPFLMMFDLPRPTKCVLEMEEVGGVRTCYFEKGNLSQFEFGSGIIKEKITRLEKGRVLEMDVTDYELVGREWLGFSKAAYYFEPIGQDSCKLTRITIYSSVLKPRAYWEPLEKLGISQEHDYVFSNLAFDLLIRFGSPKR